MFCPNCGKELPDGAKFCINCGLNLENIFVKQEKPAEAAAAPQPAAPQPAAPEPAQPVPQAPQVPQQTSQPQAEPAQQPVPPVQQQVPPPAQGPAQPTPPVQPLPPVQQQVPPPAQGPAQPTPPVQPVPPVQQQVPLPAQEPAQPTPPVQPVPPVQQAPPAPPLFTQPQKRSEAKKGGKLPVIALAAAAVVIIALLAMMLGRPKYVVNDPSLEPVNPIEGYSAADSGELGLSFLYPSESAIRDNGSSGIYIYTSGKQGLPYIQITKAKGKNDPEKYFGNYKKQMGKDYPGAGFEDIRKVSVSGKTLYMMRASVFYDGADQIIDRYIEVYPKETVEYTIKSLAAKSEDLAMAAVAESLRLGANTYGSAAYQSGQQSPSGGTVPPVAETSAPTPETAAPVPQTTPPVAETTAPVPETAAPVPQTTPPVAETAAPGGGAPGMENYQMVTTSSGFGFMVDTTLVQSWKEIDGGVDIRLKRFANDEDADITVMKNDFSSEGITTAEQFLQAYVQEMVSEGAAAPEIYDMGGGFMQFKGITSTYSIEEDTYAMYLFAADDGSGNVYTIYFENTPDTADAYSPVVNGLFATMTAM